MLSMVLVVRSFVSGPTADLVLLVETATFSIVLQSPAGATISRISIVLPTTLLPLSRLCPNDAMAAVLENILLSSGTLSQSLYPVEYFLS